MDHVEVIFVDGHRSDRTYEMISEQGAQLLFSERGRARQMNAGAKKEQGDVLVFCMRTIILKKFFLKYPQIGQVKTRLAHTIGNESALAIYKEFIAVTISKKASMEYV